MNVCAWQHFRYGLKWCSLMTRYMIARWVTCPQGNDNYTREEIYACFALFVAWQFLFFEIFYFRANYCNRAHFFLYFFFFLGFEDYALWEMQKIIEEYQIYYGKWILFKDINFWKIMILFFLGSLRMIVYQKHERWDNWKRNMFYIIQKCQVSVESWFSVFYFSFFWDLIKIYTQIIGKETCFIKNKNFYIKINDLWYCNFSKHLIFIILTIYSLILKNMKKIQRI